MAKMKRNRCEQDGPIIVHVVPGRCAVCASTERAPYHRVTRHHFAGNTADGRPYNVIVRRHTRCLNCGQARVDRAYEFVPGLKIPPWPPEPPPPKSPAASQEVSPPQTPPADGTFRDPEPTA